MKDTAIKIRMQGNVYNNEKENKGLTDPENDRDDASNVSPEENDLLDQTVNRMGSTDDKDQARATLDNTDDDGESLNEQNDASGNDLDVPGAEADDDNEELGEEDEENNSYSLGADKKD